MMRVIAALLGMIRARFFRKEINMEKVRISPPWFEYESKLGFIQKNAKKEG